MLADAYIHELGENERAGRGPGRLYGPARNVRRISRPCCNFSAPAGSVDRWRLAALFPGTTGMSDLSRFEALVAEYQDMVFAVAVRLLGNAAEAEDVSQTVFLKVFERFDELAASPALAGWLKTVTTNACLNHLARYRSRWRFFSELPRDEQDPGRSGSMIDALAASAPSVEDEVVQAEQQDLLERALRALPDHQRVPLVLFHFEDLGYQEIANLTGVSLAKVKTDIHRGREALRRIVSRVDRPA